MKFFQEDGKSPLYITHEGGGEVMATFRVNSNGNFWELSFKLRSDNSLIIKRNLSEKEFLRYLESLPNGEDIIDYLGS
jgi:hypothetical protein